MEQHDFLASQYSVLIQQKGLEIFSHLLILITESMFLSMHDAKVSVAKLTSEFGSSEWSV
jgi:hypothetical protein